MKYVVMPILGARGIPYYIVTDTSSGRGIEGYGCSTWAQHRADALNRQAGRNERSGSRANESNKLHAI